MTETEKHKKLKLLGRSILKERGYPDTEIFEEYKILIGRRNYVVDICGINPRLGSGQKRNSEGKAVAVECGTTNSEKLVSLKTFFDEVIVLPYGITSLDSDLRNTVSEKMIKIAYLENEIRKLKKVINDKEYEISHLRADHKTHNRVMMIADVLSRQATKRYYNSFEYRASNVEEKVDAIIQILEEEEEVEQ